MSEISRLHLTSSDAGGAAPGTVPTAEVRSFRHAFGLFLLMSRIDDLASDIATACSIA